MDGRVVTDRKRVVARAGTRRPRPVIIGHTHDDDAGQCAACGGRISVGQSIAHVRVTDIASV